MCVFVKRAELPDVNTNTGAQSINTDRASLSCTVSKYLDQQNSGRLPERFYFTFRCDFLLKLSKQLERVSSWRIATVTTDAKMGLFTPNINRNYGMLVPVRTSFNLRRRREKTYNVST